MYRCFALLLFFHHSFIAAQVSVTPAEVLACPGDVVVLTCQSDEDTLLTWRVDVTDASVGVIEAQFVQPMEMDVGQTRQLMCGGQMCSADYQFVATLTAVGPVVSTLTTTANTALDGAVVRCTSGSGATNTTTLQLLTPPPPPASPTITVAGQTAGTTSATVTVQWAPSTGADNYTVSVTPDLPSLGGPVTTTDISLELQDVPYNTPHTVNIVATNCAGSSAATETVINITGCVVPERPVNGDWQTFSPSTTVGPNTSLSLSCSTGYEPSEVMSSTCQPDGSWVPDTAQLECIDCGPPTHADNVVLEPPQPNITVGSIFSFRCAEGLFPNTTHEAVCGADGQWRPDPANHRCQNGSAVDCGAPQPPASGSIAPHFSTLEETVISFQCDEGFSPPEERTATCARDTGAWTPDPAQHTCSKNETGTTPTTTTTTTGLGTGATAGIVVGIVAMVLVGVVVLVVVILLLLRRRSGYNAKHKSQSGDQHEMHVYDERKDTAPEPGAEYSVLHHNTSTPQASNSAELSVEYSKLNTNGKQETPGLMYAEVGHQGPKNKKKSKAAAVPTQPSNDDDDRVMYSAVSNITMPTTPMEPARLPVDKTINLDALLIQLADAGALWYQLGEVLGVPRHTLDEIKEACAVSKQFMVEMLDAWLRLQPYPTWREVASALQVIGATELASNILMVYSTGELPKRVNMTEVPVGSLPHDFHSGPPPPIPPKAIGDSPSPPAPARPQRSGAGASKRAPPPIPGKSDSFDHRAPPPSIDYRAPPPLPRSEPPPPQLPTRLDPVSPPSQWPDAPAAPPRPPKVSPRGGAPDAPARPPKPVPRS